MITLPNNPRLYGYGVISPVEHLFTIRDLRNGSLPGQRYRIFTGVIARVGLLLLRFLEP